MNIIFVANRYVPNGQATQGFMAYLNRTTKALMSMGHNVVIVACGEFNKHYQNDEKVEIFIEGITYEKFDYKPYERLYNYFHMSYIVNRRIMQLCKERHFDVIQFTSLSALSLLYFGKVPAVMRLSSYAKIAYQTHQTLEVNDEKMISFLERRAAARCKAVFAPCQNTAVEFAKDTKRKVFVIESPFYNDVVTYDESVYQEKLYEKKYALFFGRLYVEKGIIEIAESLPKFFENNPDYYFVFCGESASVLGKDARKYIKEHSETYLDKVIFIAPLSHESLYPIIRNAQFVVLPSLMENLSNACIEAMSFGKVVIGTDGASFEQLIVDGENGLLCKIGDAKSLLKKMNQAAKMDVKIKEMMGQKAIKRIACLRPEIAIKRLERFYKRVIKNKLE